MSNQQPPHQPPPPTGAPVPAPYPGSGPLPGFTPAGPGWNGPPPSNKLAVIALICAIIPFGLTWIAAIVLAIIVLRGVRKGTEGGRGLAIAALVISLLWIILLTFAIAGGVDEALDQEKARDSGSGDISVEQIRVGDCLAELPDETTIYTVTIVPCDRPHRGEVFAIFPIDLGSDAPQDDIDRLAEGGCTTRFGDYVGIEFNDSVIDVTYLPPLSDTMDIDDRSVCLLTEAGEPTTGSLKGAAR